MVGNIKVGDICTLVHNNERIFKFCGTDNNGFPLSDCIVEYIRCMLMWDTRKPANPVVVAVTDEFRLTKPNEIERYNKTINND